jgi:hypothetical protein
MVSATPLGEKTKCHGVNLKHVDNVTPNGEDLPALARFAFDQADKLCSSEHGCAPYHKTWSFLRLFERGGALPAGEAFYREQLESVVVRGGKRVLLSGAADTGLMALVLKVFSDLGVAPDITLVDLCSTVIEQNRLFCADLKIDAVLFKGSIHDYAGDPFDAIFAHSFMLFFPKNELTSLARTWRNLLKDDGIVLSTDYMATSLEPVWISALTREEIENRLVVLSKAAEDEGLDETIIAELRRCARVFFTEHHLISQTQLIHPSEMRESMKAGGLDVITSSTAHALRVFSSDPPSAHFRTTLGISRAERKAETGAII